MGFVGCIAKHLLASVSRPPGERWQFFCDNFLRGFVVPYLEVFGRVTFGILQRVGEKLESGVDYTSTPRDLEEA